MNNECTKIGILNALNNIETYNEDINAFITVDMEGALEQCDKHTGNIRELSGVAMAVKDNICVANMRTTCGSRILKEFVPFYNATAVEKLKKAGATIIGKTNMDEFGMGSTTTTSYFGATKNPVNPEYITGGSSGGSCAAVAAGMCDMALGSDTGGSIRQPAAYCGVVGIKPTYGTVSRYGLVAYASSLEQIGPVARNVADCTRLLQVIAGYDEKDSTSVRRDCYDFEAGLVNDVKGMKIALIKEYFTEDLDEDIEDAIHKAAKVLEDKGAIVSEISMPYTEHAVMAYYVMACAEASSNLARFDGVKYGYRADSYADLQEMYVRTRNEGFGEEVRRRISLGEYVLSSGFYEEYYLKALKVRRLIKEQFDKCFAEYDAILAPVTKVQPARLTDELDNIKLYMEDMYTVPANLCGFPAMTVPFGMDRKGLPIGVQLMGACFNEKDIIRVAYTLEQYMHGGGGCING